MIEKQLIYSSILQVEKTVRIFTPAAYSTENLRYPVLYMNDGKNVFTDDEAIGGVSLALADYLSDSGHRLIVVGIDASEDPIGRIEEYCPWKGGEYSKLGSEEAPLQGGKGKEYVQFIVEELKPFIDQHFRTQPNDSAIGGISLGGLISTYAACTYPGIFNRVMAISSGFWRNQEKMEELIAASVLNGIEKFYMDWGTKEGKENDFISRYFDESNQSIAHLLGEKIPHAQVTKVEGAEHSYSYFKQRLDNLFTYSYQELRGGSPCHSDYLER